MLSDLVKIAIIVAIPVLVLAAGIAVVAAVVFAFRVLKKNGESGDHSN